MGKSNIDKTLSVILIIALIAAVAITIYIVVFPQPGEKFTEFYILGPNGKAGDYPSNLTVSESGNMIIGIVNLGLVAAVKQVDVLDSAFQYGIIAMIASLPLFGGAATVLAATGTISLLELANIHFITPMIQFASVLLLIGIAGETGIAPFFATKAEMFRTPGSPFLVIIHLSSLLVIIRAIEILLIINKPF